LLNIPEGAAIEMAADAVDLATARVFADTALNFATSDGLTFQFGTELLGIGANVTSASGLASKIADFTDRAVTDVSIVRNTFTGCRTNDALGGDIISITAGTDHIPGLEGDFFFDLPMNLRRMPGLIVCGAPTCGWWNKEEESWETDGCRTLGVRVTEENEELLMCACSHLTDFAVLLNERQGGCWTEGETINYKVVAGAYGVVALISATQLGRLLVCSNGRLRGHLRCSLYGQHSLIFLVAIFHCVSALRSAGE
jgi:hypothetical protein